MPLACLMRRLAASNHQQKSRFVAVRFRAAGRRPAHASRVCSPITNHSIASLR